MRREDVRYFDRSDEYAVTERLLPHWGQAGTMCFITWRTPDSLPGEVLRRLDADIAAILETENLPPDGDWKSEVRKHPPAARDRVHWKLFATRDKYLDAAYGLCLLRKRHHAQVALNSLLHFDEDRYFLTDAVIMPNHVHFLAAFSSAEAMLAQCSSWKRFIARKIHAAEGRHGPFWQVDQFDHLVRSEAEFEHYRRYIQHNPTSAQLKEGQFLHYQKPLPG